MSKSESDLDAADWCLIGFMVLTAIGCFFGFLVSIGVI